MAHIGNKAWHFENNNKIIQGTFNIKKKPHRYLHFRA